MSLSIGHWPLWSYCRYHHDITTSINFGASDTADCSIFQAFNFLVNLFGQYSELRRKEVALALVT